MLRGQCPSVSQQSTSWTEQSWTCVEVQEISRGRDPHLKKRLPRRVIRLMREDPNFQTVLQAGRRVITRTLGHSGTGTVLIRS